MAMGLGSVCSLLPILQRACLRGRPLCILPQGIQIHGKSCKGYNQKVTVGEYTIVQLSNNALYVYKGERCVMHASSAKKMTEDELKEMVAHYEELCNTDIGEEVEDEQREAD